ncbi:hypothetical protein [Corynebacterium uterequi]|uniref:Uncharacterized protein n=1 Tax=Corynebacterium uterequi TaxID=1072256 RepID=A0A0G3HFA3_9CORY|nr:hypothetical protein [Corynebacterium uterequi]AKK11994.1 hypothetical protein CUTER_10130 [Corynebacterium uterequi]
MSVLTVIDPAAVPTGSIAEFLHWHDLTTEWAEDRDYGSTEGTSEPLVTWLERMSTRFPPVVEGATGTTRYIIGSTCVYARFADGVAEAADARAAELAEALGLGLYRAASGRVLLPGGVVLE